MDNPRKPVSRLIDGASKQSSNQSHVDRNIVVPEIATRINEK